MSYPARTVHISRMSELRLRMAYDRLKEKVKRKKFYSYLVELLLRGLTLDDLIAAVERGLLVSDEDYAEKVEGELRAYIRQKHKEHEGVKEEWESTGL